MKNSYLLALLVLAACGADATDVDGLQPGYYDIPDSEIPGQEGRVDSSVWIDGMFNRPEAKDEFCTDYPDAWFCSEMGEAEQAWTSHQGHGHRQGGGACFGPQATEATHCLFPQLKQFKLSFDGSLCKSHSTHGTDTFPVISRPTEAQLTAMVEGFVAGVFRWNDSGVGVKVQPVATAPSGYQELKIRCDGTSFADSLAETNTGLGSQISKVTNLPTAPNGQNQKGAIAYTKSQIIISAKNLWKQIRSSSACGVGANLTLANIRSSATWVGVHEGGHVQGFTEFSGTSSSNPMKPFYPGGCPPTGSIGSAFINALTDFETVPETGANASIPAGTLPSHTPQ